MAPNFYITLNLITPDGFESYGRFLLGNDKHEANQIFKLLRGNELVSEKSVLSMDLTEDYNGIPIPIKMIHCSLDELAHNTKIISREVFKRIHLKTK